MPRTFLHTSANRTFRRPTAVCDRARSHARAEEGQALVEFSLVLLPFLLLFLGFAFFGLAINGQLDETHLASQAARMAAVNDPSVNTEARLKKWVKENGDSASVREGTATLCFPNGKSGIGEPVEVKLEFTNKWGEFLPKELNLPSTTKSFAEMRIEVPLAEAEAKTC
jgi:hypothetical protein